MFGSGRAALREHAGEFLPELEEKNRRAHAEPLARKAD